MKKTISIILAVSFMLSFCTIANAEENELKFGADGKFTLLQISDPQDDHYPAYDMVNLIKLSIEQTDPDLIVFTGDIVEDSRIGDIGIDDESGREGVEIEDDYEATIANVKTTCEAVFGAAEKAGIPFAVVQGNNDYACGVTNEDWLKIYGSYKNCLVKDESNDEGGAIDFNLEIKASDSDETVFNIWLMDTGRNGVLWEQTLWYKTESAALKKANGGEP
ncbi:MAG: metallophosphoesterase, partial [Clostridia bacterium]|nr:metallophosphoesterase [Clostridia bacterium]